MARTPVYDLAETIVGGDLESKLRTWRESGETFADITHRLHEDGVTVTHETVRAWCIRLGIHAPETAA